MLHKHNSPSLTQKLYRADQVRSLEIEAAHSMGVNAYELMQRAGMAVLEHALNELPEASNILVLVGSGNNAGDGYLAALNALNAGLQVKLCAIQADRELEGDAQKARQAWLQIGGEVATFHSELVQAADLVVDAMLGIGITGTTRNEYAEVIDALNASATPVFSVDIPSGLHPDTGEAMGRCVQADYTLSFIGIKLGLTTGAGKQACGKLLFDDLGVGKAFADRARCDATALDLKHFKGLAPRPVYSHKGSYGRLLCVGGNKGMSGAIRMTAEAALRTGTGLVKVYAHQESRVQICAGRPELMVVCEDLEASLAWSTCVVIGPGLGRDEWSESTFNTVIKHCHQHDKPILIDADALNLAATSSVFLSMSNSIMTPHSGEAARLLNEDVDSIEANRFVFARQCAQRYDAICVLKGPGTIIDNQQHSWVCRHGNPGMATAGMGDVLAGIIASLIAQGIDLALAAQYGVSLHAKAADIIAAEQGQRGMLATDLFATIRALVNE